MALVATSVYRKFFVLVAKNLTFRSLLRFSQMNVNIHHHIYIYVHACFARPNLYRGLHNLIVLIHNDIKL